MVSAGLLRGQPWWGIPPFVFFWLGLLALPIVVGRAVARDDLSDREVRLILVAASIVAAGMIAQLGGMLVSQVVASVVWPGGNWSPRLVIGLVALLVPTFIALGAARRGLTAMRAGRLA
jgi:hypothetical protein